MYRLTVQHAHVQRYLPACVYLSPFYGLTQVPSQLESLRDRAYMPQKQTITLRAMGTTRATDESRATCKAACRPEVIELIATLRICNNCLKSSQVNITLLKYQVYHIQTVPNTKTRKAKSNLAIPQCNTHTCNRRTWKDGASASPACGVWAILGYPSGLPTDM